MSGNTKEFNSDFTGKLADESEYKGIDFFGGENSKYYNMYRSANPTDSNYLTVKADQACNGGVCYGHALSETFGASEGYF